MERDYQMKSYRVTANSQVCGRSRKYMEARGEGSSLVRRHPSARSTQSCESSREMRPNLDGETSFVRVERPENELP